MDKTSEKARSMKGEPMITVTCNECDKSIEIELMAIARKAYDERHVNEELRRRGWFVFWNFDFCSKECEEKWHSK